MKTKKILKLEELKLKSFVTLKSNEFKSTIKGGVDFSEGPPTEIIIQSA